MTWVELFRAGVNRIKWASVIANVIRDKSTPRRRHNVHLIKQILKYIFYYSKAFDSLDHNRNGLMNQGVEEIKKGREELTSSKRAYGIETHFLLNVSSTFKNPFSPNGETKYWELMKKSLRT